MLCAETIPITAANDAALLLAIRKLYLIGAASGSGGRDSNGNAAAPDYALPRLAKLLRASARISRGATLLEHESLNPLSRVAGLCEDLAAEVALAFHSYSQVMPLIIGGDHTCAVGTWSGVRQAQHNDIGLLWIDAHMDSHTPDTSDTGNIHGMPLAALLGEGHAALTDIGGPAPKLKPEHVALFGIRSYEAGEAALLERLGVRVYTMEEISKRGVSLCFAEALAIANSAPAGFGITFDIDALDPVDAPATCCHEPGGLRSADMTRALRTVPRERLLAAEFVELNPHLPGAEETVAMMGELINSLL